MLQRRSLGIVMVDRLRDDRLPERVLLIGWDAADWQMIQPLVMQGLMPTLANMLQRGAAGNLCTTRPILSPILWNTIATGKRADAHGILGFTEPTPEGDGIRPSASTSRRCKALWNILTQSGLRSHVVGWYASHPAEPINGTMVSNQFEFCSAAEGVGTPLPRGVVHPTSRTNELSQCRVHPSEIDATAVLPFIPDAARLAAREGNRLGKLRLLLAQTASIHAMATRLISADDWEFAAVYYEGIDRFGHEFMEFHPPRMPQVSEEDFEAYRHCMVGIYRFHDMLLETLIRLAGDQTAIVLLSDHGYWNDHRRPDPTPGRAGPTDWHRPLGILACAGPGIRPLAQLNGGSILDITPTVLSLLGLPAGQDMPGRVLSEILDGVQEPERIPSWEKMDGECGMHPTEMRVDPDEARAAVEQLVALGYIAAPTADVQTTVRDTVAGNRVQLAQSHADAGEPAKALAVLGTVDGSLAQSPTVALLRAHCHMGLGDWGAVQEILDGLPDTARNGDAAEAMRARLDIAQGRAADALVRLRAMEQRAPELPGLHAMLGHTLTALGDDTAAEQSFRQALHDEPDDGGVLLGLAEVRMRAGAHQEALELALRSATLDMRRARVHFVIGQAFMALHQPADAVVAFTTSAAQAPHWREAQDALAHARRRMDGG